MHTWPGNPYPLGATFDGSGTNFALFSEVAEQVISDEFALEDAQAAFEAAAGRGSSKVVLTFA